MPTSLHPRGPERYPTVVPFAGGSFLTQARVGPASPASGAPDSDAKLPPARAEAGAAELLPIMATATPV